MSDTVLSALIAGIVGLLTGMLGSLLAPWVNWGIEKRRLRHDRRVKLLQEWHSLLDAETFQRADLLNNPSYGTLKALLSEAAREQLERPSNHLILDICSTVDPDREVLIRELGRIEREWKLL